MKNLYSQLQQQITLRNLLYPLDVLLVGATGSGKSSTINALAQATLAKVGNGVEPETQYVSSFQLDKYLRFHDSAGLGDGREADLNHAKKITQCLRNICVVNNQHYGLIDIAMVILDAGSRDLGTAFQLLESVVLKDIATERVIVIINQADRAMKGRNWLAGLRQPNLELQAFLNQQACSVQQRLYEATGKRIAKPISYSAEYGYNLDQVIKHIIAHLPASRRLIPA